MSSIGSNLQRMRELAVQSANATNSASDRQALQKEITQLSAEIDRVAGQTEFNGTKLLDGTFTSQQFQVGANRNQTITIDKISDTRTSALGKYDGFNATNTTITGNNTATAFTIDVTSTNGSVKSFDLGSVAADAKSIATAINASGIAGLTASADENNATAAAMTVSGSEADEAVSFTLNGKTISFQTGTTTTTAAANLLEKVNAESAATGVSAIDTGSGIKFTAADGRNITFGAVSGNSTWTTTELGLNSLASTTKASTIDISYQGTAGSSVQSVTLKQAGLSINNTAQTVAATGQAIKEIDISTVDGANKALSAIDAALSSISSERANLGAIQNRFSSTIENLQTVSENLSASRGRIIDADFAQETANLTRGQILQQAGTAMLAQANSLPQGVLSLLRG